MCLHLADARANHTYTHTGDWLIFMQTYAMFVQIHIQGNKFMNIKNIYKLIYIYLQLELAQSLLFYIYKHSYTHTAALRIYIYIGLRLFFSLIRCSEEESRPLYTKGLQQSKEMQVKVCHNWWPKIHMDILIITDDSPFEV